MVVVKSDTKMPKAIGIFGGTFDPVHHGHLRSALEVAQQLELDQIRLIPSASPPHREQPRATAQQRLMMLHLAIKNSSQFVVDDRELHRDGLSYTVDTLLSLREEFVENPLYLIVGTDAFSALQTWHNWRQLIKLSHIVVVSRPGEDLSLPESLEFWYQRHLATEADRDLIAGKIWPVTVTQLAISATAIRESIANNESPEFLLPDAVLRLIEQTGLYQD